MTGSPPNGSTALVTGASRGFGRAIASALCTEGSRVVAVARSAEGLAALREATGSSLIPVVGDAADPVVAGTLIERYQPGTLVLNAGAAPLCRPLPQQTWETFSRAWDVDVRHAFHWIRESLTFPLAPGSTVIAMSSGAALAGSPLTGGYAGAKATIRLLAAYAADESARAGLGVRFLSVLPRITAATGLGAAGVAAYARRDGLTEEEYVQRVGAGPTAAAVAAAVVELAGSTAESGAAFLLTAAGLSPLA